MVTVTVDVDVDIDEFDDDDLIAELELRGYVVTKDRRPGKKKRGDTDELLANAIDCKRRGNITDSLLWLGRYLGDEFLDLHEHIGGRQ